MTGCGEYWPVSSRSGRLHVTAALAEQDAGVLLVVDAFADHGESGGVEGADSSLDLTVRAAAALAAHHLRGGDRVALRVLGRPGLSLPGGGGRRTLRRLEVALSSITPGDAEPPGVPLRLGAPAGSFVVVLSALLDDRVRQTRCKLLLEPDLESHRHHLVDFTRPGAERKPVQQMSRGFAFREARFAPG